MRIFSNVFACLIALALLAAPVSADHHNEAEVNPEEMMKQWMALMSPGEMHKKLDAFVGEWTVTTKSWYEGPGSEPEISKGTASAAWEMDGRFVVETMKSTMMGKPFVGKNTIGYDNYRKQYVGTWRDSMSTSITKWTATFSRDGKKMISYFRMDEPGTGEIGKMVRMETEFISKDEHTTKMYDLVQGENVVVMEMRYKRKK